MRGALDTEQVQFKEKDTTDQDLKQRSSFYEKRIRCYKIIILVMFIIFVGFFIATIVLGAQKDYWTSPTYVNYDYDVWQQKKPKSANSPWPPGRLASTINAINSHQLMLYGGLYGQAGLGKHNNFNDTWIYDQDNDEWTNITGKCTGDYPTFGRFHHTTTKVNDQEVYIFGGWQWFFQHPLHDATDEFLKFNFKTKVWTKINATGKIPPARGAHSSIYFQGKIYIFGGARKINNESLLYNDMYAYDIASNTWSQVLPATVPSPRLGFDMDQVDTDFYLFGGTCSSVTPAPYYDNGQCNDLWKFDTATNNWIQLNQTGNVPSARRAYNAQSSINDHMFLFGGIYIGNPATNQKLFNEIYAYEFANSTWYQLHPDWPPNNRSAPQPTFGHAITAFKGHLVVFGGRAGSSANNGSNFMWEFIPPKGTLQKPQGV